MSQDHEWAGVEIESRTWVSMDFAPQVANETGESLTEAIQKALEERWDRL
jgi:hypothetical protein